ncbi:MAG TPA: ATP-dependent DNA ligase [Gemmatimonadaceae bacterium]|nr:ATP-dependent DNA ligase [Gemmatimonadaceae bacterium]
MRLATLVETSAEVAGTSRRREKTAKLASLLKGLDADEAAIAVGFLIGWPRQGKIGVGWATISEARSVQGSAHPLLTLRDVDVVLSALQQASGKGSSAKRRELVHDLFARATEAEQEFLAALLVGEVRHGALEGVMLDAVAIAADVQSEKLRRAVMLAGDLGAVAAAVCAGGDAALAALASYRLELFRPVQPMLADSADDVVEGMATAGGGEVAIEWKLDGARIQVHRAGDRVAIYTRNLNEVTPRLPEVTAVVLALDARELILDGEVLALASDGRPLSFQDTMGRFGRRLDVETLRAERPLTPFFFDVLLCDGEETLDRPLRDRLAVLDRLLAPGARVPRMSTSDVDAATRFQADALARGHEGVLVKALNAPYSAGRRGSAWVKVKTAKTLDLVVLAVEWGSGRRQGRLSNLHLGARDPATGGFVMLGKTFKGMTDELLEWQTRELLARETHRSGHVVHVRPELVVEIAFNDVQRSTQYPGGVALRFARVKGYRPDKRVDEADTIDTVRAYLPARD